jgi:hypothetical protein
MVHLLRRGPDGADGVAQEEPVREPEPVIWTVPDPAGARVRRRLVRRLEGHVPCVSCGRSLAVGARTLRSHQRRGLCLSLHAATLGSECGDRRRMDEAHRVHIAVVCNGRAALISFAISIDLR